jgi:DNA-binding response OmpR family regulator
VLRIVSASLNPESGAERSGDFKPASSWHRFNFWTEMSRYEAYLIERALKEADGVVTRAAQLLGFKHHQSLNALLKGRHRHLLHLRKPIEPRRRSIFRLSKPRNVSECRAPQETRPITILHVEDSQLIARAVKDTLEREGWQVELCVNGTSALNRLAGGAHYDLLIFDHGLPDATGIELIEYARRLPHHRQTPVIMLSASDYRTEALSAGANVFLKKPEGIDVLVETVKRLLEGKTEDANPKEGMKDAGRLQEEGFSLLRESTKLLEEARSALARGEHDKASELMRQSVEKRQEAQGLLDRAAKLLR